LKRRKRRLVIDSPEFDEYFSLVYREVVEELSANSRIRSFTRNSDIIGAYAEASIHRLARRILAPYRVSTGAITSAELHVAGHDIPQVDLIAWTPAPLPALFELENFALVPRRSVIGVIEIKRSNYSHVGQRIASVLDRIDDLTSDRLGYHRRTKWGLGIVTLLEHKISDPVLAKQMRKGRTVALLKKVGDTYQPLPDGVSRLINFLSETRRRGKAIDGIAGLT
jgi:hypothetical protein